MALSPRGLGLLLADIIIFLIGLPANLLALQAFVGQVRQPHPAPVHTLLLSLTLADLLLLLLLPFKMIEAANKFFWPLGDTLCALRGLGFYSGICCSTWLLAGISMERYRSMAFPGQYKLSRRPGYGVIGAVVAWILSFGHRSVVVIAQYLPTNNTHPPSAKGDNVCYENFSKEQLDVELPARLELYLTLFFIPMAVTVFCFWCFMHIMLSRARVGTWKRWRAVGLAAVTLSKFLVCLGPYNVSHVVGFFQQASPSWRLHTAFISALNACIDPLIFYFSSSVVRKAFEKRIQVLRSWGASLLGRWRRRAGKSDTERGNESLGTSNVNFTED